MFFNENNVKIIMFECEIFGQLNKKTQKSSHFKAKGHENLIEKI